MAAGGFLGLAFDCEGAGGYCGGFGVQSNRQTCAAFSLVVTTNLRSGVATAVAKVKPNRAM